MFKIGKAPYYECSSKGDKRFSAFWARIKGRGGKSIEEIYQAAKVLEDGSTNLTWRQAKGKKAVNKSEVRKLYSQLWDEYMDENPKFINVIMDQSGLSDIYGKKGNACQADELWRIRKEAFESIFFTL